MPTYDLRCSDCGETFEKFLTRLLSDDDRTCPACGSRAVRVGVGGGFLGLGTTPRKSTNCESARFG